MRLAWLYGCREDTLHPLFKQWDRQLLGLWQELFKSHFKGDTSLYVATSKVGATPELSQLSASTTHAMTQSHCVKSTGSN